MPSSGTKVASSSPAERTTASWPSIIDRWAAGPMRWTSVTPVGRRSWRVVTPVTAGAPRETDRGQSLPDQLGGPSPMSRSNLVRRSRLLFASSVAAVLLATSAAEAMAAPGALYTQTNNPAGNTVQKFDRAADGG